MPLVWEGKGRAGLRGGALPKMVAVSHPSHTPFRFIVCADQKKKEGLNLIPFCSNIY